MTGEELCFYPTTFFQRSVSVFIYYKKKSLPDIRKGNLKVLSAANDEKSSRRSNNNAGL